MKFLLATVAITLSVLLGYESVVVAISATPIVSVFRDLGLRELRFKLREECETSARILWVLKK